MTASFGERLAAAVADRGPMCVGLDPHASLLDAWGLPDDPSGLEGFAGAFVDALGDEVAVVKPQSAFFERHGSAGIAVLERTVRDLRAAGCLVLLDAKRGDIGSTSQAYADAYLDQTSPLAVDAITASPFLGTGSLDPMVDTARRHGAGLFVLALTSNPEAAQVQAAQVQAAQVQAAQVQGAQVQGAGAADGRTVAGTVLAWLRALNEADGAAGSSGAGSSGVGSFGAVVGATIATTGEDLAVGGPLLVPGVGAQGGTPESVRRTFAGVLSQVLPSSSREVLGAGPDPVALRGAARRANDAFAALLTP